MPLYTYKCPSCREKFTVTTSLEAHEKGKAPACPKCGNKDTKSAFSLKSFFARDEKCCGCCCGDKADKKCCK